MRLLETEGTGVRVNLRGPRPLASARKMLGGAAPPLDLSVDGDRVAIDLRPYEWAEIEADFKT